MPLIGFAGAPFTCATYLIEGGSSKTFWETKKLMYTQPELFHALMEKITEATILYLRITSYNVCYTKLLRLAGDAMDKFAASPVSRIIGSDTYPGRQTEGFLDVYSVAPLLAEVLQNHLQMSERLA